MEQVTVKPRLNAIFRDIFDDPKLEIRDDMTANDVEGWDSLSHIDLIVAVEKEFKIKLSTGDVRKLNNVGDFVRLISEKAT
jgi:acyl carrier protein